MSKVFNRQLGRQAEDLAALALEKKDFTILKRNFANRFGEIDIIAQKDGLLIFTEVKAKVGTQFGSPEDMINKKKLAKIRHMATVFTKGEPVPCRIDVIAIVLSPRGELLRLTHYENVY